MMKKILSLALALAMLLSCSSALAAEHLEGYYTPPHMNEGQYPIAEEGVTLTYYMALNGGAANFISSYDENPSYQAVQKNTGVDIEFIHPADGTFSESVKYLLMNPDQLPDMIQFQRDDIVSGGVRALYENGVIIDLAPYLDEFAPQYKEVVMHDEVAQRQIMDGDKIYAFYKITYADAMPYVRINSNKDLLNEFGMEEPVTIEEYEAYFQKILDEKPGVIPLYTRYNSDEQCNLIMGAFDILRDWFMVDETTVGYYANAPQYKEYLELMNRWYTKGYLTADFTSLTQPEAESMFEQGQIACIAASVDQMYSNVGDRFTVTNFPYLRKTKDQVIGNSLASYPVDQANMWYTVITSSCKNVEAAIQYMNYGYTYEGSLYFSFGVEGEHWNWGENGLPQFTDEILHNPLGMTISNVSYALKIHFGSRYCYPDAIGHPGTASNQEALRIRTLWADDEHEQDFLRLPPITLTTEEAEARAELMAQVTTYADEMMLKFITGAASLDTFDAYVQEVNARGLTDALTITQGAVDRYFGK